MRLLFAIGIVATMSCAQAAEQPDLNMDDLRTFSRRFCMKVGTCLHPNIEDRRTGDTSLQPPPVAHEMPTRAWPQLPADGVRGMMTGSVEPYVPSVHWRYGFAPK